MENGADRFADIFHRLSEKNRENLKDQVRPSIYTVPSFFRDIRKEAFDPRVVCIGPIHRKNPKLQGFEYHKEAYIHHLLHREGYLIQATLDECLEKVSGSIDRIKGCYGEIDAYNDDELARMMVIDGCFILDFILQLSKSDGPIWNNMLFTQSIIYDLLLIENQIPFFVLKDIFECTILRFEPTASLSKHMSVLLSNYYNIFEANLEVSEDTSVDHILGLLQKSFHPPKDLQSKFEKIPRAHSAVELVRAGLNFRPYEGKKWLLAMKLELPKISCFPWFCCKPILRMPVLCIDDFTDLVLRNLIIYEQFSLVHNYVTAYASAIDMLIDTPDDVAMLVKSQVLLNNLGSNEKAAYIINNICSEIPVVDFFYHQQWKQLDNYYNGCWPSMAAGLKRNYFSSPWNIIALFAGIVLFALTVVQTIYAIKAV